MNAPVHVQLDTQVVASGDHVSCEVDDEMVILSLQSGEYYGLNPVALRIWTLVAEPRTVRQVRDTLLGEYDGVSEEECTAQLVTLLTELAELRLVELR